jgi:hypothetical protein
MPNIHGFQRVRIIYYSDIICEAFATHKEVRRFIAGNHVHGSVTIVIVSKISIVGISIPLMIMRMLGRPFHQEGVQY